MIRRSYLTWLKKPRSWKSQSPYEHQETKKRSRPCLPKRRCAPGMAQRSWPPKNMRYRDLTRPTRHKLRLGIGLDPENCTRLVWVSANHACCFAWTHKEMSWVNPAIVAHNLMVDPGYTSVQQRQQKIWPQTWQCHHRGSQEVDRRGDSHWSPEPALA